jgi:hypothetical protein
MDSPAAFATGLVVLLAVTCVMIVGVIHYSLEIFGDKWGKWVLVGLLAGVLWGFAYLTAAYG